MKGTITADTESIQIVIDTPRLILRGAQESDANDLFHCFSDAEVMRYWESLPHESVDVTRTWVTKMINGPRNGVADFVICYKSTPSSPGKDHSTTTVGTDQQASWKVIGKVGIWHGDEIGFLLNREYWGQGLATEALRAVIDVGFGLSPCFESSVNAASSSGGAVVREDIVADVDPRNEASLGILKKFGFEVYATKERTFQVGDIWVDSVYLSLKRSVWIERREVLWPA